MGVSGECKLLLAFNPVAARHDQDSIGVAYPKKMLVVDNLDVLPRMNCAHLICGLAVIGENLIEFRQNLETQRLVRAWIIDLDVRGGDMARDAGKLCGKCNLQRSEEQSDGEEGR